MLTQERLKELYFYNSIDGWFTFASKRSRFVIGDRAGSTLMTGYRQILIDGYYYREHRLAWLYIYGEWPEELDHIDGDRANNSIRNLRPATRSQNNFNSDRPTGVSGLRGACFDRRDRKWFSRIKTGCETIWLGKFDTAEEAAKAYREAAELHHGEFAFHNRTRPIEEAM